jgi:hypothetical protein
MLGGKGFRLMAENGGREELRGDYRLTLEEQETVITFCAADDTFKVYSTYPPHIRLIEKMLERFPQDFTLKKRDKYSVTVIVTRERYKLFDQFAKRVISEEHKAALLGGKARENHSAE